MYSKSDIEKLNIAADRFTHWLFAEANKITNCNKEIFELRIARFKTSMHSTFAVLDKPIRRLKQIQATNLVETLFSALYTPFEDLNKTAKQQLALLDQDELLKVLKVEFEFYTRHELDEPTALDVAKIANTFLAVGINLTGMNDTLVHIAFNLK